MRRIILIGYMGSGKTTVGKALSKETGMMFYDLDWYIESRMHKSVSQIFAEKGEEGFRKIEYRVTSHGSFKADSPSIAAVSSIRLLVVFSSPPESSRRYFP